MCRAMEEMRNETRLEQKKKSALKMLMAGKLSYEEIADYQELSLDEVEGLANELSRLATICAGYLATGFYSRIRKAVSFHFLL